MNAAVGDPFLNKLDSWRLFRFDLMIKGDDWKGVPGAQGRLGPLEASGIPIEFVPHTQHTSSTTLRRFIAELPRG